MNAKILKVSTSEVFRELSSEYEKNEVGGAGRAINMFNNEKTWDNWPNSTETPFDNRPTWDNWPNK